MLRLLPSSARNRMITRLQISILALSTAVGLCACNHAPDKAAEQPASAPKSDAQPPAIVQPGAPGQASTVVSKVPTFDHSNFTDADVKFMQGMIHHHNQALLMAAMIPTHTNSPQLLAMGQKIQISQSGEITSMKAWLTARNQPLPMIHADGSAMMGAMDMSAMPGMLTAEQMKALLRAAPSSTSYFSPA